MTKKLIVFKTPNCGPCKMATGVIQRIEKERPDLPIVEYCVDNENSEMQAMTYGITAFPSFVKEDIDGNIDILVGLKRKREYDEWLDK